MTGGLLAPQPATPVPVDLAALRMLVAGLCAWAIGWCYARTHGALSYSQNFVQSLVLLGVIVAMIMGIVGDSLSRALGLAAALAVVRFRTPVKDARDTTFLFMALAVGMAAGAGQLGLAALATAGWIAVVFFLDLTAFGSRVDAEGVLRFRYAGPEEARPAIDALLRRHARAYRLSGARSTGADQAEELIYDIDLRSEDASATLVRELASLEHVSAVALLPSARVGEG